LSTGSRSSQDSYAGGRAKVAPGVPIVSVQIGPETTSILAGEDEVARLSVQLSLGSSKTARAFFAHAPPGGAQLEKAIAAVEEELMRVAAQVRGAQAVFIGAAAIQEILDAAGVAAAPQTTLTIDSVERLFDRFVAVCLGRPASQEGLPSSASFAATLLILRELMHHLQFSAIFVLA
jgi:exopolyphosphatase/pppGpp-phosphohydrolase